MTQKTILIVDDEDDIRRLIRGILEDEGYDIEEAANAAQAYTQIHEKSPDLIVQDIWLHGSEQDGLEILERVKQDHPFIPVIMISGHGTIETAVSALQKGAYDFIEKPFKSDRLLLMIKRALENSELRRENHSLKTSLKSEHEYIGQSTKTQSLQSTLKKVAKTSSRVLLYGAPGVGKDFAARYLHENSERVSSPFQAVNCAVLSPDTLETELFGVQHPKNNDGEAQFDKGVFEQVNGGTLFLSPVSDMPLETQGKIVKVLQNQKFRRVGGTEEIHVDVRIVAASSVDLQACVSDRKFRDDLFYCLNVVPIEIPSLKGRKDDIDALSRYFMAVFKKEKLETSEYCFSPQALTLLMRYDWPGNVRELKNLVERVLIMTTDSAQKIFCPDHLPDDMNAKNKSRPALESADPASVDYDMPLRDAREMFEKDYLSSQLEKFDGNISNTAKFIGMERSALHRKLKALDIVGGDKDQTHLKVV
jgi:two-component system nitrogen regulation response regulator NtrX